MSKSMREPTLQFCVNLLMQTHFTLSRVRIVSFVRWIFVNVYSPLHAGLQIHTVTLDVICHCQAPPVHCTCLKMTEKVRGTLGFIPPSRQSSPAVIQLQTVTHAQGGRQRSARVPPCAFHTYSTLYKLNKYTHHTLHIHSQYTFKYLFYSSSGLLPFNHTVHTGFIV